MNNIQKLIKDLEAKRNKAREAAKIATNEAMQSYHQGRAVAYSQCIRMLTAQQENF